MREAAYIIQNITDTSLVVLDELGKGKSKLVPLALTWWAWFGDLIHMVKKEPRRTMH